MFCNIQGRNCQHLHFVENTCNFARANFPNTQHLKTLLKKHTILPRRNYQKHNIWIIMRKHTFRKCWKTYVFESLKRSSRQLGLELNNFQLIYIYICCFFFMREREKEIILKTPCSVTPPPPHFRAWRLCGMFRQVVFEGACLPTLWLSLFALGWCFGVLGRSGYYFSICG